jgi:hypothetical protein
MRTDNSEFLLQRESFISVNAKRGGIFWLRLMNVFFTKAPLVMFEAFEYACDYTHESDKKFDRNMVTIISILAAVLVLLCAKRFAEYKSIQHSIKGIVAKINSSLDVLLDGSGNYDRYTFECLCLDQMHKQLLISLAKSEFVSISSRLNMPPRTARATRISFCPSSHAFLEGVETIDLWLGIVWLAYCFLGKFRESGLNLGQMTIIFTTALAYMFLHFKLPHSDLGAADSEKLAKLSVFFAVHASYYAAPIQNRGNRSGSLPENHIGSVASSSLRRHSV